MINVLNIKMYPNLKGHKSEFSKILGHSLKSGPETQDPGTETLRLGSSDPVIWNLDTWDSKTGTLGLGACDPETQNPETRTLRIEL